MSRYESGFAFDLGFFLASASISEFFEFGTVTVGTGTSLVVDYADQTTNETLSLTGTFGSYVDGYPTTGTINSISYRLNGTTLFTITEVSISVQAFTNFALADDLEGLFNQVLGGSDTIQGSNGGDVVRGFGGDDILDGGAGQDQTFGDGGNDLLVVSSAPVQGEIYNGGTGTDTLRYLTTAATLATTANGQVYQGNLTPSTLSSIERLEFGSLSGSGLSISLTTFQIGAGLSTSAEMVGGAEFDQLTIVAVAGGTYTLSGFSYSNWNNADEAFEQGDSAVLIGIGNNNYTLNAAAGHLGVQALIGGNGNDTLNGTDGMEVLIGNGGMNVINAGGGDDIIVVANNTPFGGVQTNYGYDGNVLNGGSGFDWLSVGGYVEFNGDVTSIEGINFQAAFTATGPGAASQGRAELDIEAFHFDVLPANLHLRGTGLLILELIEGTDFDGSQWVHVAGSSVEVAIIGSDGSETIIGTSGDDFLYGHAGADILTGGAGADSLGAGTGDDTFRDTAAGLNGDTLDFGAGDRIIITDATLAGFNYTSSGTTLTYTGGSLTLSASVNGTVVASAAVGGGVQLSIANDVANDFNGDGRSDIMFRHDNGAITNFLGTANGGILNNGDNVYTVVDLAWDMAGTGDFNGDGRDDVLWRNDNGAIFNLLGTANGGVQNNGDNSYMGLSASWTVAGVGDFNGDGRDDILFRDANGVIFDYLGTAAGGFTGNTNNLYTDIADAWHVAGVGDFNGDGRDDIMFRNDNGAITNFLGTANGGILNNGDNIYTVVGSAWHIAGVGDFNGDGRDDILWRNDNGDVFNFLGTANGGVQSNGDNSYTAMSNVWHVEAIGDYNGDGRDDILWRNDNGTIIDWLGTASGGYTDNSGNLFTQISLQWQVVPADALI